MVKIKRGQTTLEVTRGAFRNFYEKAGWHIDDGKKVTVSLDKIPPGGSEDDEAGKGSTETDEDVEDDQSGEEGDTSEADESGALTDEELLEIPVAEMTSKQLKRVAGIIDFDYKAEGITKTKKLRDRLKEELSNREG